MLVYFNTVLNHAIWKERNEIKFEFSSFAIEHIVSKIIKSIRGRKNMEHKLLQTRQVPFHKDLNSGFFLNSKKYLPIDNVFKVFFLFLVFFWKIKGFLLFLSISGHLPTKAFNWGCKASMSFFEIKTEKT